MATKLGQYNGALDFLGTQALLSLTEEGKERRALDRVWDESTRYLLSQAAWNFAIRASEFSPDTAVSALFGFDYAFERPTDYQRLVTISDNATFTNDFEEYETEGRYWFANVPFLYVRYVSDDENWGYDLTAWPESFALAHQAWLAFKSGLPITSDKGNRNDLFSLSGRLLTKSKTLDALEERVKRKAPGGWTSARFGTHRSSRDNRA